MNPTRAQITYEVRDLFKWIDDLVSYSAVSPSNEASAFVLRLHVWVPQVGAPKVLLFIMRSAK
jgi:hypothetical protein